MAKTVTCVSLCGFFFKAAFVCLLLSTSVSGQDDDLLDSLRFTRDALRGFSKVSPASASQPGNRGRSLNKYLEIENEIEKAVVNAKAVDNSRRQRNTAGRKETLKRLFIDSLRAKSYGYARDVLGKLLHLVKTDESRKRKKRAVNLGQLLLQELRSSIGNAETDTFLAMNGKVSLMFVIDDTGSMSQGIEIAKKIAIAVVNNQRKGEVEYILSPFNDPMEAAGEMVFKKNSQASEFIEAINSLVPHGGEDCPEHAFQGMLNALEIREEFYDSSMYVFTDADPKEDEGSLDLVKALAKDNDVKINIFAISACGRAELHPDFLKLAKETSGRALLFKDAAEMEKLGTIVGETIPGTANIRFGSSRDALRKGRRKRSSASPSQYRFPVDASMETIIIYVKTTQRTNGRGIILKNPTGTIVTDGKATLSTISIYTIVTPVSGYWTLEISEEVTGEYEYSIESSSQVNIDFQVYFMIPMGRGQWRVEAPFPSPMAGKSNKMVLRLALEGIVDTSSLRLQILTESGDVISNFDLRSTDGAHHIVHFTSPTTPFKLKLTGNTLEGHTFEREYHNTIKPTTAFVRGKYANNEFTLPLNRASYLHFQICNFGASERFNITSRRDTMGYVLQPTSGTQRPRFIPRDRCITTYLRAKATSRADEHKMDTVVLEAKGKSSGVEISGHMRLLVDV